LWDTIKAGKIWQGEVKNRRKDGSHYWVYATVGPLLDADGYPYRYISMRIDITKQKDLEEALRRERALIAEELRENLQFAGTLQQLLMPVQPCSPMLCKQLAAGARGVMRKPVPQQGRPQAADRNARNQSAPRWPCLGVCPNFVGLAALQDSCKQLSCDFGTHPPMEMGRIASGRSIPL
jgi:hypothetical protein